MIKRLKISREFLLTILSLTFLLVSLLSPIIIHAQEPKSRTIKEIKINSKTSLVHLGSIDSFDITEGGVEAGKFLFNALETGNNDSAQAASKIYDRIIPLENYGGEYTALQWFAKYLLASNSEKEKILADKYHREFFNFWAENNFANLKEYIQRKYKLKEFEDGKTFKGQSRISFLEDFILFNNPRREEWEKTSKIMQVLNLKPGMRIADIGSGPGYYTFKFSEAVGPNGKVFGIDTVKDHVNFVSKVASKYKLNNIDFVYLPKADNIGVAENQVDLAYMCSLYHIIYTVTLQEVQERYLNSLKKALKPDGRFVVVDNALVEKGTLPYHGPYIAKELVISQLEQYGFRLEKEYQFIPQRYILIFKKA
ncbi:class I SAM-dependent methyltransferase [Anabaena sp. FACHB-1237]|uniref:class I SAM-dependent methyltransferase n=1 Tax=Anabaena sp. FACHB-1237 TaxID=2692769 RepID=UPI001680B756|nr:methyltransferase domain-containing protein [Anabaena sp. FACHB-1237]